MRENYWEIAKSCFIGAVVCTAVAFLFAPHLFWVGTLAGFCTGYLSYRFSDILESIPRSVSIARIQSQRRFWQVKKGLSQFWGWIKKPHPYLLFSILGAPSGIITLYLLFRAYPPATDAEIAQVVAFIGVGFIFALAAPALLVAFTIYGASHHKFGKKIASSEVTPEQIGYRYSRVYSLALRGLLIFLYEILLTLVWRLWKRLAIGITYCFYFISKFLWILFKFIHSRERVLCGVDAAIAGTFTYLVCINTHLLPRETSLIVFLGGVMGAVLGLLNYALISKRFIPWIEARVSK